MEDVDTNAEDGHPRERMLVAWLEAKFARQLPTMVITASVEYISASANRFNRTAAASSSSLIAFGSGKFVALWDTQVGSPLVHAVI